MIDDEHGDDLLPHEVDDKGGLVLVSHKSTPISDFKSPWLSAVKAKATSAGTNVSLPEKQNGE